MSKLCKNLLLYVFVHKSCVGDKHGEFIVELHHVGFFVGYDHLRSYVDGKISRFDNCEVDTWSTLWLDDFVD